MSSTYASFLADQRPDYVCFNSGFVTLDKLMLFVLFLESAMPSAQVSGGGTYVQLVLRLHGYADLCVLCLALRLLLSEHRDHPQLGGPR